MNLSAKKASYTLPPEREMTVAMSESQQNESQPERSSSGDFRQDFISKTSIAALPFTVETSKCLKRFWWCVLAAAMMMAIAHITYICVEFNGCKKIIKVRVVSEKFKFPAVTFCNINPVRYSKISENAPGILKSQIDYINPAVIKDLITYLATNESYGYLLDDIYGFMHWNGKDEANTPYISTLEHYRRFVLYKIASQNGFVQKLGHQYEDMLIKCMYSYKKCTESQLKQMLNYNYGNCYTWRVNESLAHHTGRDKGLKMTFYLETDEYIQGLKEKEGILLVTHEQNTFPSPRDEGIFLPGGSSSAINLGMTKFNRIQSSCDPCESSDDYIKKYNYTYSRNFCESLCAQRLVMETCKCFDGSHAEIKQILTPSALNLSRCNDTDEKDLICMYGNEYDLSSCGCFNPCTETVFSKEISQVNWPPLSLIPVLTEKVCQRMSDESCQKMKAKTKEESALDFLEVEIYFESSNYEELEEKWETEWYSFLSEVGGSTGLWLGFTAVSIVELLFIAYTALKHYKRKFF